MIRIILYLALAIQVQAATNVAANLTLAEVQSQIASAAIGDTILLPAGSITWTGTLLLTNPVTLLGAGTNATIITKNGSELISITLPTDLPTRISSISFVQQGHVSSYNFIIRLFGKMTMLRIDRCKFTGGAGAVALNNWTYGVTDHCTFINCNTAIKIMSAGTSSDNAAWLRPITLGTTNTMVVEDCAFLKNSSADNDLNEDIYGQYGARVVVRRCYFNVTSTYITDYGKCFLWEEYRTDPLRGPISAEIYSNVFLLNRGLQGCLEWRGGQGVVYSNNFITASGSQGCMNLYKINYLGTDYYPWEDSISNSFFYANFRNGSAINPTIGSAYSLTYIQLGRDYWNEAPSASNGKPIGVYNGYQPLIYPHPMVTYQDTGYIPPEDPDPPTPPTSAGTNKIGIAIEGNIGNIFRP
jgi:hypothetical protein